MVLHHLHQIRPLLLLHRADLATLAFFFLLRVGDYTMPSSSRKMRTVQFRVVDVTLYRNGYVIPPTQPLDSLMVAAR